MNVYILSWILTFFLNCNGQFAKNNSGYYLQINNSGAIYEREAYELNFTALYYRTKQGNLDKGDEDVTIAKYMAHLEHSSIIFGLTTMANETKISQKCYQQLKLIRNGVMHKEPWAMKVLDASGTKPSGFMFGQNFWLGSREACGAVQEPVGITLSKDFERVMYDGIITQLAPFDMNYRVIYLRHNSPWQVEIKLMSEQIIHVGLCLPNDCSSAEIQNLTALYVQSGHFVENNIYDMQSEVIYMKDLQLKDSFYEKQSFKIIGIIIIITTLLMVLCSLLRLQPISDTTKDTATQKPTTEMSALNFIKCFDVTDNLSKLFRLNDTTANDIPVINGLRSVCAIWIMIFHVMWFMYFTVNNKTFLISYAERIFFQYVSSAPLLVDVFFTISGFLQTYNFLGKTKQMETISKNTLSANIKLFIKMLFHRFLRLAPLYLVVMGVVDLSYAYMGDVSVYHINERFDEICSQHWWRNLLFIQNFFDHQNMCLNWTWSLACEMQYFILATILLFVYVRHANLVKALVCGILVSNVFLTYAIGLRSKFLLSFDSAFATGTDIYINPLVRIMPYVLGALTAWYFKEQQSQLQISDTKTRCFWNFAILIFFSCIYSTIKRDMTYLQSISLFIIGRLLFSLSVCWMIVGSATGRASWWSKILEVKIFQHFNRLSYAIYLLNPFVIAFIFSFTSVSTHADPLMLTVLTSGFAIIVYMASIVFSLAFEIPYCNLSSLLLKQAKQKPH